MCNVAQERQCLFQCSGHGACQLSGHCICDEGFAGRSCARAVPQACAYNCGGHGACLSGGVCACDAGFGGTSCSVPLPASAVCPLGCSGRGLCGPAGGCICEPGFEGSACERVAWVLEGQLGSPALIARSPAPSSGVPSNGSATRGTRPPASAYETPVPSRSAARLAPPHTVCPGACSGHGTCHRGACRCHKGFGGLACERVLPACAANCSGHGVCDPLRRECVCHEGYDGAICSIALATACPLGCSAHGTCSTRVLPYLPPPLAPSGCGCRDGLAPPACAHAAGSRRARVARAVARVAHMALGSGGERCPLHCSGRGHCHGFSCVCAPGFGGAGCELATPRCPADCNEHGACVDGFCECSRGWGGVDCAHAAFECPGGCAGHGTCVGTGVPALHESGRGVDGARPRPLTSALVGVCACHAGYSGAHCDQFALPTPTCAHNCSGRGTCTVSGVCNCAPGYTGPACATVDDQHGGCPKGCCGHGACRYAGGAAHSGISAAAARALGYLGAGTATRRCECDRGFGGDDCCSPLQEMPCKDGCSGRGLCVRGQCHCTHGWRGEACEVPQQDACSNACSAHGECREDGTCRCERGFSGTACEHGDPFGASVTNGVLPLEDERPAGGADQVAGGSDALQT